MTKEQWKDIEEYLGGIYVNISFRLNDRKISVAKERISDTKLCYTVYIDNFVKGAWMLDKEKEPLVAKVWYKKIRNLHSRKFITNIENQFKKRYPKTYKEKALKYCPDLYDKYVSYLPQFTSKKTLINTLKKVDGLELIKMV